jgi:predicted RNase H-like nuclease (RuvC/YqgF family)
VTPSPEARPDLEARARARAHEILDYDAPDSEHHSANGKTDLHYTAHTREQCDRLTSVLLEREAEREALQRERDRMHELMQLAHAGRDTALADLAAARADLDSATVLYAQVSGDLAALRRRVGEALALLENTPYRPDVINVLVCTETP